MISSTAIWMSGKAAREAAIRCFQAAGPSSGQRDEILDNETELPINQHSTDTAGYSELIFSLFDLVGLQFSPRIRDMADQRLYRLDRSVRYQHIEPLFSGTLNQDLILRRWDDLLRVAGSVKMGWVTASLLGKLQSDRRQNALMRTLQVYGRLIKTIHI